MPNYYSDYFRANIKKLRALRKHISFQIAGRKCLVIGSAPDAIFPHTSNDYIMCINGSAYSLHKNIARAPDITFLNKDMFITEDKYTERTFNVLSNANLGDILINPDVYTQSLKKLDSISATYNTPLSLSRHDRRFILGDVLGHNIWGGYKHLPRVSNGVFMSALALWCGASSVVLIGFSLNSEHAYSSDLQLRTRKHIKEDIRYFERVVALHLPISTTSEKLAKEFQLEYFDVS